MTNKKLKMAAMSVALTACVAASPLAANADAPEAAPGEPKTEPVTEETKKEENTAEPQVNLEAKNAQETLKDAEVKYNKDNPKDNPTTNPDGFQKLDGVIVTNPNPDPNPNPGSGETNPNPDSGETNPNPDPDSGKTDPNPNPDPEGGKTDPEEKKPEEIKPEEKKPEEKKPEQIGTAEKTEKSETNVETKPNPGAEPIVDTTTPPTVEKNPDGSTTITQPTVTPGTETTTTTGTGEATGNLHEKKEEVPKADINLKEELGEKPDISWNIEKGADAVNGYKVEEVTNSDDGNQQTLKLRKEEKTTAEMTAEDIAKLVDAEKPTVNPDGTYTLTRTETILDAEGNPQTRTTYITIRDNKVTTKTTTELTITREKVEHNEETSIPTDVVFNDVQLNNGETLPYTKLDEMLKEKGDKNDDGSVKDGKYTYQETDEDGTVREYTITIDTTSTDQLSSAEIVAKLNNDRYSAEGEDIYYRADNGERVKLDVKQKAVLRRNLSVNISVTETKKGSVENESTRPEEESKAKMNAIRKALNNAVVKLGVEDPVKAELESAIANETLNPNGGTFEVKLKDGKTYTLTYTGADVRVEAKEAKKPDVPGKNPEDITDVKDNTVTGTAYVTGSKITYLDGGKYATTGMGGLGIGENFNTKPDGATEVKTDPNTGRITSYKDKDGKTYRFTYEDVGLNDLDDAEKAALNDAAKRGDWNPEILNASLTRVSWTVMSPETTEPKTTPIENGTPVDLSEKKWNSKSGNNGTVDFTHDNKTYAGMTLVNTAEDGKTKTKTETYKKTDTDNTVTIITVTTRQLGEEEIKAKFGSNFISLNLDDKTVTYTGEDGKTYKASYVAQEEKLTVEVQKPQAVAATGSTEKEARDAFLENLEKARQEAMAKGETLVIEYEENGEVKYKPVTKETKWEDISHLVGNVVNYNAMTNAELVEYLKKLETTAKKDGKYYTGSTDWDGTPYYWDDASGKMQRVPPEKKIDQRWYGDYVIIDGEEHRVHYNRNDIDHLDLATDSHLTLSEKEKDGKAKTDDCVLLNPTLKWSESAETLVKGGGTQANFVDRITYDHENDNNPSTGHYEYPRASWDEKTSAKDDNAPTKSVFYKVEGKVAYGKLGDAYEKAPGERGYAAAKQRAEADLKKYIADHPELDLSKAQVVEIYKDQTKGGGKRYYQIYLYQSDLTAYGYMSDDNNTCGNALFEPGSKSKFSYIGGYDLTLGDLTQTDEKHVVAMGKNTIALSATIKRRKLVENLTNRELRYTPKSVTETIIHESEVIGQDTDLSGSYQANYTKTADYRDEQQGGIAGTGEGHYKSFTNLIRNIFNGEGKGTEEGGFIKYVYHSEKNEDGTPVKFEADKMVVTTKQDAEVHYTFTSQESRDVWIKGYTQTVVPPVNPGPDTPELPPVEDAKPAPAPEAPVLPVVQDARPDPAPTPAPAPAPETPVLPAVQDAKLIQTGTSGWLADLMLGAGMVLSAAGYWMERKRKAMFYKSQH